MHKIQYKMQTTVQWTANEKAKKKRKEKPKNSDEGERRREERKTKSSLYHCLLGTVRQTIHDASAGRFQEPMGGRAYCRRLSREMRSVGLTDWRLTGRLLFLHGYKARHPG